MRPFKFSLQNASDNHHGGAGQRKYNQNNKYLCSRLNFPTFFQLINPTHRRKVMINPQPGLTQQINGTYLFPE